MALLTILEYPDRRLRTRAAPVQQVDDSLRELIDAMLETMYASRAIGLAATQVNVHQRLLVADLSENKNTPLVLVNPQILCREVPGMSEEVCLSVPGVIDVVERALRVRVRALDRHGKALELEAEGLLAACIAHEIDHLDGILFIDHLSWLKRIRTRGRFAKSRRRPAAQGVRSGATPA